MMADKQTRIEHALGAGGDSLPEGLDHPLARWLFLEAVQRCVPEAMRALASIAEDVPERYPYHGDEGFQKWCETWGFVALRNEIDRRDWLQTAARRTAASMRQIPNRPDAYGWVLVSGYRPVAFPELRVTWDRTEEPEASFRARIEQYIAQVKATPGQKPAKRKRVDPGNSLDRDFEWTALRQVGNRSYDAIAKQFSDARADSLEPDAVQKAVESTADLLGLKLRAAPRGRPRVNRKQNP